MLTSLGVLLTSILIEIIMDNQNSGLRPNFGIGLFLILVGKASYFQLLMDNNDFSANFSLNYSYHLNFCEKRSSEAIEYWTIKC